MAITRLTRQTQKIFGVNQAANQMIQIGSLAAGSPNFLAAAPASIPTLQSLSNYLVGWYNVAIGNNSPSIEDMNGLFFLSTYQLAYCLQAGVPEYDASTTYYIGNNCAAQIIIMGLSSTYSATVGATYTLSGITYTVLGTIAAGTRLVCQWQGATTAPTGGIMTKSSGTGDASIGWSSATYSSALYTSVADTNVGQLLTNTSYWLPVVPPQGTSGTVLKSNGAVSAWGQIVNADVSASAAIAYSKLTLTGAVVNADVAAAAAIDYSKLAALTASRALVSSGGGVVSVSSVTATQLAYLAGATGTTGLNSTLVVYSDSPTFSTGIGVNVNPSPSIPFYLLRSSSTDSAHFQLENAIGTGVGRALVRLKNTNVEIDFAAHNDNGVNQRGYVGTASNHKFEFIIAGATKGGISTTGLWTIGATSTSAQLDVVGGFSATGDINPVGIFVNTNSAVSNSTRCLDLRFTGDADCTGGYFLGLRNSTGTIIGRIEAASNTTTSFTGTSDARLKDKLKEFDGLAIANALEMWEFEWISNPGVKHRGPIAQQVYKHLPEVVSVGSNELAEDEESLANPWGIDYGRLSPIALRSCQQLDKRLKALEEIVKGMSNV